MFGHLLKLRGVALTFFTAVLGILALCFAAKHAITHIPNYDELLHVLAARGIISSGEPLMGSGRYDRAELYTYAVAASYRWAGDSLVSARLPALLCALALVAAVSIWVSTQAGRVAGISASLLIALLPITIDMAVFARFYSMHALSIFLCATASYLSLGETNTTSLRKKLVLIVTLFVSFAISMSLQDTTLIGVVAISAGCIAVLIYDHFQTIVRHFLHRPLSWLVGLFAMVAAGLLAGWQLGFIDTLRSTALWAASTANSWNYYNGSMRGVLPMLWPMLPFACLLAYQQNPRLTLFSTGILLVGLTFHSIAAMKAMRYIYYLLPFCCAIWGTALAKIVSYTSQLLAQILPRYPNVFRDAIGIVLGLTIALNSIEGTRAVKSMFSDAPLKEFSLFSNEPDWQAATKSLQEFISDAQSIIVSSGPNALYAFGRFDYELNASIVAETDSGKEFGIDPRTGKQAISTTASVDSVLNNAGSELIVLDKTKISSPLYYPKNLTNLLEQRCTQLSTPSESQLLAWWCAN